MKVLKSAKLKLNALKVLEKSLKIEFNTGNLLFTGLKSPHGPEEDK